MEELNAIQNEMLMDETIKHELERIKDLEPGSNEYKAAYECAAKFYEIRMKEKTSQADKNAREDELQMKNQELRLEAEKAETTWKTEAAKVVAGIVSTALGAFLMIRHDRFWAICSAGGVQVFDDRYKDGKMIYKDYCKKSV
jgi:hypothetical protein